MSTILSRRSSVVYCPRSNAFLKHQPHPVRQLLDLGVNVALGTDSLASNNSLGVLDEMRFLFENRKDIKCDEIVRMATLNGATALGFGGVLGRLRRGYWADAEATRERYHPGPIPGERLCYTGDLFTMDEEGYFYFVARKDDIIKSRGEKVSPKEIESVLYSIEGVTEAAVVGVPDPIQGQAIKVFVAGDGTMLSEAQVMAHCRSKLEDFMVPKHVVICKELPKTTSGKIKKTDLR